MVNDKPDATVHPAHPGGYAVMCETCGEVCTVLFDDVAELLADRHRNMSHPTVVQAVVS